MKSNRATPHQFSWQTQAMHWENTNLYEFLQWGVCTFNAPPPVLVASFPCQLLKFRWRKPLFVNHDALLPCNKKEKDATALGQNITFITNTTRQVEPFPKHLEFICASFWQRAHMKHLEQQKKSYWPLASLFRISVPFWRLQVTGSWYL